MLKTASSAAQSAKHLTLYTSGWGESANRRCDNVLYTETEACPLFTAARDHSRWSRWRETTWGRLRNALCFTGLTDWLAEEKTCYGMGTSSESRRLRYGTQHGMDSCYMIHVRQRSTVSDQVAVSCTVWASCSHNQAAWNSVQHYITLHTYL